MAGLHRLLRVTWSVGLALAAAACGPSYSPDTYASSAVQQAAKVDQGVVIGVREVAVSVSGGIGAVAGGAAGGIAGAQVGTGAVSALSALGGTLLGGLAGTTAEKVASDTRAFEYIVRKPNGDLVSVTQKDEKPLALGTKVLVIAGTQARIVPDYTVGEPRHGTEVGSQPLPPPSGATPSAGATGGAPPVQAGRDPAASPDGVIPGGAAPAPGGGDPSAPASGPTPSASPAEAAPPRLEEVELRGGASQRAG